MSVHQSVVEAVGLGLLAASATYQALTVLATFIWRAQRRQPAHSPALPPISVLKPLCGAEIGLYENLRSYFVQQHAHYQLIFGVCDATDPALKVVADLTREFPDADVAVVVSNRQYGGNRKVSNLINMSARARHDVLVMSDSDARVDPDYLSTVTAPLLDLRVGLVTCIYRDTPAPDLWSRLGAMYINDWYIPSVLLAWLFGHRGFVSGQTICLRRDTLDQVGGLAALADHLADDYMIGQLVRDAGLRVVLSDYLPRVARHEPTAQALLEHEVRWMRTILVLKPWGFRCLFLSFSVPMATLGWLSAAPSGTPLAGILFATVVCLRLLQHGTSPRNGELAAWTDAHLIPARDFLLCYSWLRSLLCTQVSWRGADFIVSDDGIMRASHETR